MNNSQFGSPGLIYRTYVIKHNYLFTKCICVCVCVCVCMYVCIVVSMCACIWLFVTPWTVAPQAPLSIKFSRHKYGSGLTFPPQGDLLNPVMEPSSPESPALAGGFFATSPPEKPIRVCVSVCLCTSLIILSSNKIKIAWMFHLCFNFYYQNILTSSFKYVLFNHITSFKKNPRKTLGFGFIIVFGICTSSAVWALPAWLVVSFDFTL